MDIVAVKGAARGERERMWVTRSNGSTEQVPINMIHDLPHLVVESALGLRFGFWGLIDAGAFGREISASHARDNRRKKDGRAGVLMGRARQSPLATPDHVDPLVAEHEEELIAAKALTNAFRDYGDTTPQGVRERLEVSAEQSAIVRAKIESLDDLLIERVQAKLRDIHSEWRTVPPGGRMHLQWPLAT